MTIELAIALIEMQNGMEPAYEFAPDMAKQVLGMRAELAHSFDADARTVTNH